MPRPRVPLGLEGSRATLNTVVCAQIGRDLAEARRARGLSIKAVAERLLLAPAQVTALEEVHAEVFYGADFYVKALRKYAALLELDTTVADRALIRPEARTAATPAFRRGRAASPLNLPALPGLPSIHLHRPSSRVLAVAAVVVTATVSLLFVLAVRGRVGAPTQIAAGTSTPSPVPPPAAPVTPMAVQPSVEPIASVAMAEPEPSAPPLAMAPELPVAAPLPVTIPSAAVTAPVAAAAMSSNVGHVRVARRTWIFVRYHDNKTVQRGLGPGEEFVLEDRPTYIAVGVADNTALVLGGQNVDNAPFTTNGQLRVGGSQLAKLTVRQ